MRLAKVALRPGAGNMVNGILRKLALLKVCHYQLIHAAVTWLPCLNPSNFGLQESNTLPLPKVEGDERAQARALAVLHSHPVVSTWCYIFTYMKNVIIR